MTSARFRRVLSGVSAQPAFGVTWVPPAAVSGLLGTMSVAETVRQYAVAIDADVAFVPASQPWASECAAMLRDSDIACAWAVDGAFSRVCDSMGWARALRLTISAPGELGGPLADAAHDVQRDALRARDVDADVVVIAEEVAHEGGWLVSPEFVAEVVVPHAAPLVHQLAAAGIATVFHSDGDVSSVFPVLRSAGFAGVHAGAMARGRSLAVAEAARATGLLFLGGIQVSRMSQEDADAASEAVSLRGAGPVVICDDGGLTTVGDIEAYRHVMSMVRTTLEGE